MKFRFNRTDFVLAIILFFMMVILAVFGSSWGVIRSFVGDILAVMCVYCMIASIIKTHPIIISSLAFLTGVAIECGQYLVLHFDINIPNKIIKIIFGSTPDWWDIVAYALGALIIFSTRNQEAKR